MIAAIVAAQAEPVQVNATGLDWCLGASLFLVIGFLATFKIPKTKHVPAKPRPKPTFRERAAIAEPVRVGTVVPRRVARGDDDLGLYGGDDGGS